AAPAPAAAPAPPVPPARTRAGPSPDPPPARAPAAAAAATVNPDLTFSAIWTSAPDGYPITYQSYVLVYEKQTAADKAAALKEWIGYLDGDGQSLLPDLNYAKVPDSILTQAQAQLAKITG